MRLSRNGAEISRCTFRSGAVDIEDRDTGAFRHEPPGGRKTYPSRRGRTRNNSRFAAKQHAFLPGFALRGTIVWRPSCWGNRLRGGLRSDKRAVVLNG
jgi:hypothetical protein